MGSMYNPLRELVRREQTDPGIEQLDDLGTGIYLCRQVAGIARAKTAKASEGTSLCRHGGS